MAAEAAISYAVQLLGDLLIQKVNFLQGVEGEVEWLKDELKKMQRFLIDADEKQAHDSGAPDWRSNIIKIAHDAEDAIETFVLKVENERRRRGLLGNCATFGHHLKKVREDIKSIKDKLADIESSLRTYGIQDLDEGVHSTRRSQEVERRRQLARNWEKDKDVVGLEEDVERLLEEAILDGRKGLSIVAIEGMLGIGKSTLARTIYNHAAVATEFECRAWVVVSSKLTSHETIKQVLLKLPDSEKDQKKVSEDVQELEKSTKDTLTLERKLQEMVHRQLNGKRYFIVVDDVCKSPHWETLTSAFPNEDKCSRVLLTSRHKISTECASYVHDMKPLNSEESWKLFLKKASINNIDGKCPEHSEILEKCHGLPLAISVAGGLLVEQTQSKSECEKVLKEINTHLESVEDSVYAILEVSYQNLPPQLKLCFLSLAFFKEDAPIKVQKLIHFWIGQGFVLQEEGGEETMEDIAMGYLDELINRNIVEVKDMAIDDQVESCLIHDFIRGLSIRKAKEEISFEILNEKGNSQSLLKTRHRAMYNSGKGFINPTNHNQYLRTLFVHGVGQDIDVLSSCWKSFELLRVLDFEGVKLEKSPDAIGGLIGLRYLGLRNTDIRELPRSLLKLKNLQVIDISGCNIFLKIPKFFPWKMDSLRHVYYDYCFYMPPRISTLKNLQTLNCSLTDLNIEQLRKMPSLCKLHIIISRVSDENKLFTTLAVLRNLVNLTLCGCGSLKMAGLRTLHCLTHLTISGYMSRLPSDLPPQVSHLALQHTNLQEDPMPVLERQPNLRYLKLERAYDGKEMVISHAGFPMLARLYLTGLNYLQNITVGQGMPVLERFKIYGCKDLKIENLPEHLRSVITFN